MFTYNENFYNTELSGSYESAKRILPFVCDKLHPKSIIDFGCGIGTWCFAAKELGITSILGIDGPYVNKDQLLISKNEFKCYDISQPIKENKIYDLAISVEVAEHISSNCVDTYIHNLISSSKVILFSAAIPGQKGTNHINEQYLSYWVKRFKPYDFVLLDLIRSHFWYDTTIKPWYKNNIVIFARADVSNRIQKQFPLPVPIIDIVHPELFEKGKDIPLDVSFKNLKN